jgi:CHAT domain-containing protein/predicted Zn-dependent protease
MKTEIIRRFWAGLFMAATSFFISIQANSQERPANKPSTQIAFNRLLKAINADSPAEPFSRLQDFLENHADFEPVYHALLEWSAYRQQTEQTKQYFQNLATNSTYARNSHWMLAKIFIREENPHAAYRAFTRAISAGPPSISLLDDFIKFHHQNAGVSDGAAFLRQLNLPTEMQQIVSALDNYHKSEYQQAIDKFQKAPREISHSSSVIYTWGECFYILSRFSEADSLWRIGLIFSKQRGELKAQAKFLANLGLLQQRLSIHDTALSYYDSAYALAKQINDLHRVLIVNEFRASIHRARGNYTAAEKQYHEAIQFALQIGERRRLAELFRGYGMTLYYLGRYNDALKSLDKSEPLAQRENDITGLIRIKQDKATICVSLRQLALAQKSLREAIHIARSNHLTYEQKLVTARLGEVLLLQGNHAKAREFFAQFINYLCADKGLRKDVYEWLGRFGRSYLLQGNWAMAKSAYSDALEAAKDAGSKLFEGWYLLRLGDVELNLGNLQGALANYDSACKIALEQKNTEMLWEILLGYGNAHKKMGNLRAAISAYRRAAAIIEETRSALTADPLRIGYFIESRQIYQNLATCFLQRYEETGQRADLDSLYYYLSMERGRALRDLRFETRLISYSGDYKQAHEQLTSIQRRLRLATHQYRPANEIKDLLADLETARLSLLAQRLRLSESGQFSNSHRQQEMPHSLSMSIDRLQDGQLGLLLYRVSEDASFVLVISGKEIKIIRLQINPSSLALAVDSLMSPFHNADDEQAIHSVPFRAGIAHRLYKMLLQPVEQAIRLPEKVLILPDFALTNLPFEMLLVGPPEQQEYSPTDFPSYSAKFLLHRYTFAYSPSAFLFQENSRPATNGSLLVFANPIGTIQAVNQQQKSTALRSGWSFEPLPFSEIEGRQIKEVHPQTRVYRREEATKAAFLKEARLYQNVHMATHAFVDTAFDAFSGLALAVGNDSTDDGMLMGYEIADLDLPCDLISLSACETGRGTLIGGEGILGLPRLFLGAGAQSVLMTLWKVDDKFSSNMMPMFYKKFLREKLSKIDALGEVKRAIVDHKISQAKIYYQHPFYWASFALYGDPGISQKTPQKIVVFSAFAIALLIALASFFLSRNKLRNR